MGVNNVWFFIEVKFSNGKTQSAALPCRTGFLPLQNRQNHVLAGV
jgi:hypothetical protein